ncbi:MAG: hypothetical protein RLZZ535_771 [Cyanobacteriota bacterium]|jgi:hypothetical protein
MAIALAIARRRPFTVPVINFLIATYFKIAYNKTSVRYKNAKNS